MYMICIHTIYAYEINILRNQLVGRDYQLWIRVVEGLDRIHIQYFKINFYGLMLNIF